MNTVKAKERSTRTEMSAPETFRVVSSEDYGGIDPVMVGIGPVSAKQKTMMELHKSVAGVPGPLTREEALALAQRLKAHRIQVMEALAKVMKGDGVIAVGNRIYQSMLTGTHGYINGTSGIGKTTIVKLLTKIIGLPTARLDGGLGDLSDMKVLGDEKKRGDSFEFVRGILTQPGLMVLLFDEVARAPAYITSLCLQAMAERTIRVVLYGQGEVEIRLSPYFVVICTANPFGYGGSATKNEAFMDRIGQGLDMAHPSHEARMDILMGRNIVDGVDLPSLPLPVSLADIRAAMKHIHVSEAIANQIITLSYMASPAQFRNEVKWTNPWAPMNRAQKDDVARIESLSSRILTEGSNPRGEELILLNAVSNALMDGRLNVSVDDVRQAARAALRFRLKPFPGCDSEVTELLDRVLNLILPG